MHGVREESLIRRGIGDVRDAKLREKLYLQATGMFFIVISMCSTQYQTNHPGASVILRLSLNLLAYRLHIRVVHRALDLEIVHADIPVPCNAILVLVHPVKL